MTNKPRILLVDDDKLIVAMVSDILKSDFDVVTAADGQEAIDALTKEEFDAVLCDQNMPKITGVEVLKRCIELRPRAVRVLITATEKVEDVAAATNEARVHRVVVKPVREVELVRVIAGTIQEARLKEENKRLLSELQSAVAELQEREKELERELNMRNQELRDVMAQLKKSPA